VKILETRFASIRKNFHKIIPLIRFAREEEIKDALKMYKVDLNKGLFRCMVCGDIVNEMNIGMLIKYHDKVLVVCKKESCMEEIDFVKIYDRL